MSIRNLFISGFTREKLKHYAKHSNLKLREATYHLLSLYLTSSRYANKQFTIDGVVADFQLPKLSNGMKKQLQCPIDDFTWQQLKYEASVRRMTTTSFIEAVLFMVVTDLECVNEWSF